ncbi:MAG: DEAD/DEAH box helicase family protein [Calothrix sp. FI2-JRJ7]|nr:DEAD/DEAH box helicase family protein [Calothrix sp. FI2-JRJ7]
MFGYKLLIVLAPGIIKAGYKPTDSLIQVGSIQTLARRKNYPGAGLVIIDEAHHASANSYRKLIEAYPNALILGETDSFYLIKWSNPNQSKSGCQ